MIIEYTYILLCLHTQTNIPLSYIKYVMIVRIYWFYNHIIFIIYFHNLLAFRILKFIIILQFLTLD